MKSVEEILLCTLDMLYKLSVIVTGIAMAVFAYQQVSINKKMCEDSKTLHQPNFRVVFEDWRSPDSDVDDHTNIIVKNIGEAAKSIGPIDVITYIQFDYRVKPGAEKHTYYIPVEGYFTWFVPTGYLEGEVAISYNTQQNKMCAQKLHEAILEYNQNNQNYAIPQWLHLTRIQYVDKYDQSKTVYFINENNVTVEDYEFIKKESDKLKFMDPLKIDAITLQKLISLTTTTK